MPNCAPHRAVRPRVRYGINGQPLRKARPRRRACPSPPITGTISTGFQGHSLAATPSRMRRHMAYGPVFSFFMHVNSLAEAAHDAGSRIPWPSFHGADHLDMNGHRDRQEAGHTIDLHAGSAQILKCPTSPCRVSASPDILWPASDSCSAPPAVS